jgi:dethiobiotin synthetase
MTRPSVLVFVTGTGTDIGKTWWTARTARELLGAGVAVAARKPVQSGTPGSGPSDADVLAAATGEAVGVVCLPHRNIPLAWAPPMAAEELGMTPFTIADLAGELSWPALTAVGFVEGAGGPRSPVAADGDNVDLADEIDPDLVVLVTDLRLGAINAVRLAAAPFPAIPLVVACNRYEPDPLSRRTLDVLRADGFELVTSTSELAARLERSARPA